MTQIYVRPAREGLLVPFEVHQPGRYIGMRHAVDGEAVAHQVHNGHGYVAALPSLVKRSAFIERRISQGDLVEVSPSDFAALVAKAKAGRATEATTPDETNVALDADEGAVS